MTTLFRHLLAPLHRRIGLIALGIFLAFWIVSFSFLKAQQSHSALETTQRMNFGLAKYLVEHHDKPLIQSDGSVAQASLKALAQNVMMTNPALEVYLLDPQGRVMGHQLESKGKEEFLVNVQVDMAPVLRFGSHQDFSGLPLLGTDPRNLDKRNVFSVQPIQDAMGPRTLGYLYVILNGAAAREIAVQAERSGVFKQTASFLALGCFVAFSVLLIFQNLVTRPLRLLARQVQHFDTKTRDSFLPSGGGGEIASLEREFSSLRERIGDQLKQIEASDQARSELVASLSHDLFTPLGSIRAHTERSIEIRKRERPGFSKADELGENLQVTLKQVGTITQRLSDLFKLSSIDATSVKAKLELVYVDDLLQDVMHSYQLFAQRKGVVLTLRISPSLASGMLGTPPKTQVYADIGLLERVLQNLLDNALRFTGKGGSVTLDLSPEMDRLKVSVIDTGSGIESHNLSAIHDRTWVRSNYDQTDSEQHAGLGLAIVRKALALHDSELKVNSMPNIQTCFSFALALAHGRSV